MKGSYTIEVSLLMGIILPVLVGIIYLGFFWHDQVFLQTAAHEAVSWVSLHQGEEKPEAVMKKLINGRLLGSRQMEVSGGAGKKEAGILCQGTFEMPGLLQNLFEMADVRAGAEVYLNTEQPSRKIQKIRGLMKITDSVRGKRE